MSAQVWLWKNVCQSYCDSIFAQKWYYIHVITIMSCYDDTMFTPNYNTIVHMLLIWAALFHLTCAWSGVFIYSLPHALSYLNMKVGLLSWNPSVPVYKSEFIIQSICLSMGIEFKSLLFIDPSTSPVVNIPNQILTPSQHQSHLGGKMLEHTDLVYSIFILTQAEFHCR